MDILDDVIKISNILGAHYNAWFTFKIPIYDHREIIKMILNKNPYINHNTVRIVVVALDNISIYHDNIAQLFLINDTGKRVSIELDKGIFLIMREISDNTGLANISHLNQTDNDSFKEIIRIYVQMMGKNESDWVNLYDDASDEQRKKYKDIYNKKLKKENIMFEVMDKYNLTAVISLQTTSNKKFRWIE